MAASDHVSPAPPVVAIIAGVISGNLPATRPSSDERWIEGRAISTSPSVEYAAYRVYFGRNSEFSATLVTFNSILNTNFYVRI
jgi:hypothetical protein